MEIISLISFTIFIVLFSALGYFYLRIRSKLNTVTTQLIQTSVDKQALLTKINELHNEIELKNANPDDGFVKFLSTSRDWAFQYIEEVQSALLEFDKNVAPDLEWANTFGQVLGENAHTSVLNRISEAYDKLKEVLPKENQTPNN